MSPHTEIADQLARRLKAADCGDQVLCLQLPVQLRSPSAPVAVCVTRGTRWHIVAMVDWWNVVVAAPPALPGAMRNVERHRRDDQDIPALADEIADVCRSWWSRCPEDVCVFDVAGAITNGAAQALGVADGEWSSSMVEPLRHVGIGRRRPRPQWPEVVFVANDAEAIRVDLPFAESQPMLVRTAAELSLALPLILDQVRAVESRFTGWLARVRELHPVAAEIQQRAPQAWTVLEPWAVDPAAEPSLLMQFAGAAGATVMVTVKADVIEVAGGVTTLDEIAAVLDEESRRPPPPMRMEDYR